MAIQTTAALYLGKTISWLLKTTGRGATAAPGYYALKIDPHLLKHLALKLDQIVIITGTNGKTTTSSFIANILNKAGIRVIHNKAGSNLVRGLTSTLIQNYPLKEKVTAIFEVDEATIPAVLDQITPNYLVVNNLFRDQLDRYGEVAKVHSLWKQAFAKLPQTTTILLNSDDPNVADLGRSLNARVIYFGLNDPSITTTQSPHTIDARVCPLDGQPLTYQAFYLAHLGLYRCTHGDFQRTEPQIKGENIQLNGLQSAAFVISTSTNRLEIDLPLAGVYNLYNSLAAASTALPMGIAPEIIKAGMETTTAVFGRQQQIKIQDKTISLNLVKNPVGFNEVIRLLTYSPSKLHLLLLLNDHLADGTDVSWIWDTDLELLKNKLLSVTASGNRSFDLANRIKYADLGVEIGVEMDPHRTLQKCLTSLTTGETLYILPTYTAMLQIQRYLASQGHSPEFWQ